MTNRRPTMPVLVDKFLADAADMDNEALGAYTRSLFIWWRNDLSLSTDEAKLLRACGCADKNEWKRVKDSVLSKYVVAGDALDHPQQRKEAEYIDKISRTQSQKATTRWKAKRLANNNTDDAGASVGHMPQHMPQAMPQACRADAPVPVPDKRQESSPSLNLVPAREAQPLNGRRTNAELIQQADKEAIAEAGRIAAWFEELLDPKMIIPLATYMPWVNAGATLPQVRRVVEAYLDTKDGWKPDHPRFFAKMIQEKITLPPPEVRATMAAESEQEAQDNAMWRKAQDWAPMAEMWTRGKWLDSWGPKPGEPRCWMPALCLTDEWRAMCARRRQRLAS